MFVGLSQTTIRHIGLEYVRTLMVAARDQATVPILFHLDHGNVETAVQCIEVGFNSVMVDMSDQDVLANASAVAAITDVAHARSVAVEGQIGQTWDEEDDEQRHVETQTRPDEADEFVRLSKVDFLAISMGSTPGRAGQVESINLDLLTMVSRLTKVPIVLHGGSSVPDAAVLEAISRGVAKVNIDRAIREVAAERSARYWREHPEDVDTRKVSSQVRAAVSAVVMKKMEAFGSTGRV